ncbi:MAG: nucleotide exchange factor GrpE [Promethearchaeota archaeon]
MTKKKEKNQEKTEKTEEVPQIDSNGSEGTYQNQAKTTAKEETSQEEVKLLEEKEGAGLTLEYFSKEGMANKVKELEECVKEKDGQIKQLKEWKDKFMRLQAEFENTQKRWEKNRQYLRSQYTASTLKNFLPLYDSFKKAIENTGEDDKIKQFYNQFMGILKFTGAEPMQTKINDPFDYSQHEALTSVEKDDVEENRILDIIQEGWKYDKEVLRFAKVVISKKPKPPEPELEPEAEEKIEVEPEKTSIEENENKEEKKVEAPPEKEEKKDSDKNEYIS